MPAIQHNPRDWHAEEDGPPITQRTSGLGGSNYEPTANLIEIDIVRYLDRFIDKRELEDGMTHWNRLMALITEETEDGRFADQRRASAGTATTGQDGKEEEQAACLQSGSSCQ